MTRAKFDFVTTRLFSKFVDGERRDLLCPRTEIVRHLNQRFSDWSGGQYKKTDADYHDTTLLVLTFDDFIAEGKSAADLGEMLANNLFERVCEFKESSGEVFMVPEVSAAAIECNVTLANKVIELVSNELQRTSGKSLRSRYAGIDANVISNAVSRTIDFGSALSGNSTDRELESKPVPAKTAAAPKEKPLVKFSSTKKATKASSNLFGVNRWLLLVSILAIVTSLGFYIWSEYYSTSEEVSTSAVKAIDLEKPELKQYFRMPPRVSGSTFYAIVSAEYEKLDADAQREYLQKLLQAGSTKGYNRVSLVNTKGKAVGYASAERIETGNK